MTAIFLLSQTEKRRCPATSIAIPDGESQSVSCQVAVTVFVPASSRTISFLSSIFTKTVPVPSTVGNSGFPGRRIVEITVRCVVSMTVTFSFEGICSEVVPVGVQPVELRSRRNRTTAVVPEPGLDFNRALCFVGNSSADGESNEDIKTIARQRRTHLAIRGTVN